MLLLLSAFIAYIIYYIVDFYRNVAKYPKGPTPLPFIGNLHQLTQAEFFRDFERFREEYGSVFTVFMPEPVVVLADYESAKEGMTAKGDDFSDRPTNVANQMVMLSTNSGIVSSNGPEWLAQRRVSIAILRDFGMGKNGMEQMVLTSIDEYLKHLDNIKDKDHVDFRWPIQTMVANIINEALFGFRYVYDDCNELHDYVELFNKLIAEMSESKGLLFAMRFPIVARIPILNHLMLTWLFDGSRKLYKQTAKSVEYARSSYRAGEEPACFVHAYLDKINEGNQQDSMLNETQLLANCTDLFLAGQETTSNTLRWAMLLFAAHQDVQDKVREEINSAVPGDRLPSMADKPRMLLTMAAVHEVQRRANILPVNFSLFRQTRTKTNVQGKNIPACTMVCYDIHQIHAKDEHFERPNEFRPERYLAEDGKSLRKDLMERTIPFGLGKRQCAGEGLARVELFLGIAATLQRYRILPPVDGSGIDLEPQLLNILLPKPHKLQLVPL